MSDDHLPISLMSEGLTPAANAAVAPPMRRLCAPNLTGSRPAAPITSFHHSTHLRYGDGRSVIMTEQGPILAYAEPTPPL